MCLYQCLYSINLFLFVVICSWRMRDLAVAVSAATRTPPRAHADAQPPQEPRDVAVAIISDGFHLVCAVFMQSALKAYADGDVDMPLRALKGGLISIQRCVPRRRRPGEQPRRTFSCAASGPAFPLRARAIDVVLLAPEC